jgi:branched-chain amino acid transport system substrate-binding protein
MVRGRRRAGRGPASVVALATATLLAVAGCGSGGSGGSGSDGLPKTVNLLSIQELTGAVAKVGLSDQEGEKLAVDEINQQKFLGDGVTLNVDYKDSGYNPTTAASLASQGIASNKYAAILGPPAAQEAVAIAPIAQKGKMPTLFTQSSSQGVLVGDYIYRVTAPQQTFYADVIGPYLKSKNVKTLSILYSAGSPTPTELATKIVPDMQSKYGFTIKDTKSVSLTTTDVTAPIAALVAGKPDAIAAIVIGANNPGSMTQLRQNGFTGPVILNQSADGGVLDPAGKDAAGAVWATDFNAYNTDPATKAFVAKFQARYNKLPNDWHAEAYDAVWMAVRALKKANSTDHAKVQAALDQVAQEGFTGALGDLKFENRDLRAPGVLVQYDGKETKVLQLNNS